MFLHIYNGHVETNKTIVECREAINFLEAHPTLDQEPDNFVGFTAPEHQDAVIQFIRHSEATWLVDIPVVRNDVFQGSYVCEIDDATVFALTRDFFDETSSLRLAIVNQTYNDLESECKTKWEIELRFDDSEV